MDSFQSIYSAVRRVTRPMILRKLELIFYLIFIALAFVGFILPSAVGNGDISCYVVGVLSLIYITFLYFFRLKINVSFGLLIHLAVFLLFSSFIIFDFGLIAMGATFACFGVAGLSVICILHGLGHRVAANGVNEPPVNQAWPEVGYQANNDGRIEDQILDPHWQFEPSANPPDRSNDFSPEMLNDDVADPRMQENDNVNPDPQNN